MIKGSCLCGSVSFEVARADGPFELCHCGRCRRASGGAHLATIGVRVADFHFLSGRELITTFRLPIRDRPPAYQVSFCTVCGSPTPPSEPQGQWMELAAGTLDAEFGRRPERHIFADHRAPWDHQLDRLPELTASEVRRARARTDG